MDKEKEMIEAEATFICEQRCNFYIGGFGDKCAGYKQGCPLWLFVELHNSEEAKDLANELLKLRG